MRFKGLAGALALIAAAAAAQGYQVPRHSSAASPLLAGASELEMLFRADAGMEIEQHRSPADELEEHRRLDRALKALAPQRPGTLDAYLLVAGLDSDPVFGREARGAAAVLQRRYGAAGRTMILAGSDGSGPSALPRGSPGNIGIALARFAELMDEREDVLILLTTSHGTRFGLYYHDVDSGYGAVSPSRLKVMLDGLGLSNRLLIINACYSGMFVPVLASDSTAIVTAAAADRTSFGCAAENDWTFFGDAFLNRALRKPQPLAAAFAEANRLVAQWEPQVKAEASRPQIAVGAGAARWLDALEKRMPRAETRPVGRASLESAVGAGR
jgi:hypothetical protein